MTPQLLLKYLWGDRDAILQVARSSASFWFGIVLVMTAGVARQYDQSFILEAPARWFLGSLIFSTITGHVLFSFLYASIFRPNRDPDVQRVPFWTQWRSFMGCYWMTAPIAWLYAIPVERIFDSIGSVQANYILLAVVAAWRVGLMARVYSTVSTLPFLRVFPWVILFASIEFLAISIFGGFFNRRIMAAMGGMENSPEEQLLLRLVGDTMGVAFYTMLAAICAVIFLAFRRDASAKAAGFPVPARSPFPIALSILLLFFWAAIAVVPQREQSKSYALDEYVTSKKYRAALDYLAANGLNAFAPSRPIPPKLYENRTYDEMAGVFAALKPDDPQWLLDFYFEKLTIMFSIRPPWFAQDESQKAIIDTLAALKRLPGSRDWARSNQKSLLRFAENLEHGADENWRPKFDAAVQDLLGHKP